MQVRLPKRTFAEALGMLERIIPGRASNPALTHLRFEVAEGGLRLQGSNGELDLELVVPAEVEGEAVRLVPGQLIGQVVRNLPGELVELGLEEGQLTIESGSFATRLTTADPAEFPPLAFEAETVARLPARELGRALARVRYAASGEDYRAIFRGVQLELHPTRLRSVASDGFRLALYDLELALDAERKFVVPARSVDEIVRVLERTEGEVALGLLGGHLTLAAEGFRMAAALMEGEFPDYERVIPPEFALEAEIDATALKDSLKRVKVLADRNNHRVDLVFEDGRLEVVAEGDYGRGVERLEVDARGEAQMVLAYNAEYLEGALGPIAGKARLRFSGAASPSVIQDAEDGGYLAVVVPLRV
ncbi:DNA polymerase III, beta subunit [Oceanithermus profundus DSM 14977]|uniref:Beta sliding clamp n=1 Tax=Oceanithermus profundus (strain DSM 14977 / NBRC 100410 / VKM B-2274 / 506) TaxID=670487 RepID=E4U5G5_OCEP5|nr:DNA polymerase III subunit beta [Oceanithermus profundus]ADR35468.1 DNA polymerase III, beta subunit [Oceanithermus profundus DSM 14977]